MASGERKAEYLQILTVVLLHKHEVHRSYKAREGRYVVPSEPRALKEHIGDDSKYDEADDLLDDLQLNEREGPAIVLEAYAVGRYLAAVFQKGDSPAEDDDTDQGPVATHPRLL